MFIDTSNVCRLLLLCLCFAAPAFGETGHSAVATHTSGKNYRSDQQPNTIAASAQAMQACRLAHASDAEHCELTSLNGNSLITSAEIKARIPDTTHPLYLWRLAANDATVYLAGSIHILKPGFYPLPQQFEAAFAQSDYLVLEVDTDQTTPTAMQALTLRYAQLPPTLTLSSVLPEKAHVELAETLDSYGINLAHFERFKPNFVTQQLTVLALSSVGYDTSAGLESHFRRKKADRSVLQLETVDFQLDLLFNAPLDTQVEMTLDMLKQMASFEDITADLVTSWLAGDDEAFLQAIESQSGDTANLKAFNRKLLIDRNYGMADAITGYLQTSGTYFVLVGAAHLIGDEGIPALLKKAGYDPHRFTSASSIQE